MTLANMADITSVSLANFENGKGNMQLKRIEDVLEVLGYEIDIHLIDRA